MISLTPFKMYGIHLNAKSEPKLSASIVANRGDLYVLRDDYYCVAQLTNLYIVQYCAIAVTVPPAPWIY